MFAHFDLQANAWRARDKGSQNLDAKYLMVRCASFSFLGSYLLNVVRYCSLAPAQQETKPCPHCKVRTKKDGGCMYIVRTHPIRLCLRPGSDPICASCWIRFHLDKQTCSQWYASAGRASAIVWSLTCCLLDRSQQEGVVLAVRQERPPRCVLPVCVLYAVISAHSRVSFDVQCGSATGSVQRCRIQHATLIILTDARACFGSLSVRSLRTTLRPRTTPTT